MGTHGRWVSLVLAVGTATVAGVAIIYSTLTPRASDAGELCFDTAYIRRCDGYAHIGSPRVLGFSTDGAYCVLPGVDNYLYISSSATSPHIHQGPIVDGALYLWNYASAYGSYGFGQGWATFTGDISILGYEPAPGRWGTWSNGQLYWGSVCELGTWVLSGRLIVEEGPVSAQPSTWGRVKAMYR